MSFMGIGNAWSGVGWMYNMESLGSFFRC